MQICFGKNAAPKSECPSVIWDSQKTVNGHMLLCGMSGSGKTFTLKKVINEMLGTNKEKQIRFHVFDVHGDIDIANASCVQFSEQTNYGLNPLKVNSDPHFGGVRKRTNTFISIINKCMRSLGEKQEAALRNILYDVYERHGFDINDHKTWNVEDENALNQLSVEQKARLAEPGRFYLDIPIGEKDDAKELGRVTWESALKCWWCAPEDYVDSLTRWPPKVFGRSSPSLKDALHLARNISRCSFLGSGLEAVTKLEVFHKKARVLRNKKLNFYKNSQSGTMDEKIQDDLNKAADNAIEAYTDYVGAVFSGNELKDLMKYQSSDVMASVVNRLENLDAIGIFKSTPPPFDEKNPVWRYDLRALGREEKKLFVLFQCEEIFEQAFARGEQDDIVEVIILDEAHLFLENDPDNIINTISKEARKFGVALVLASQSPTHFTEDFISSVATKVILGIDEMYWKGAASKMNLSAEALAWIKLKRSILVQIKSKEATKNNWNWTYL